MNQHQSFETQLNPPSLPQGLLGEISQAIYQFLSLKEILQKAVVQVQQYFKADRVLVYQGQLEENGTLLAEAIAHAKIPSVKTMSYSPWNSTQISSVLKQGKIYNSANLKSSIQEEQLQPKIKSELIVPIFIPNRHSYSFPIYQMWGSLVIHQCDQLKQWQASELDLLEKVTIQIAIAIVQVELLKELQATQQEIKQLKTRDDLTQIANRHYFKKALHTEWKRLQRESSPLSLILCRLDYFERYNEAYGCPAGDSCLQLIAAVLLDIAKRPADLVARYGTEEFAILLPSTNEEGALQVAETIRTRVKFLKIPHIDSPVSSNLTMSLGVTSIIPIALLTPEAMLKATLESLKKSQKNGCDCVEFNYDLEVRNKI